MWRNQFLFWAIVAGFVTLFPLIYIPILNTVVFKHAPIDWEWGIVFVAAGIFFAGVETWKWCKRVYFRRKARKTIGKVDKNMDVWRTGSLVATTAMGLSSRQRTQRTCTVKRRWKVAGNMRYHAFNMDRHNGLYEECCYSLRCYLVSVCTEKNTIKSLI